MNIGIVTVWFERGAGYVSRAYAGCLAARHSVFIYARGGERPGKGAPKWDCDHVTWASPVESMSDHFIPFADFKRWVQQHQLDAVIFNEQHNWSIILEARKLDILLGAYVDYYTPQTISFFRLYDFLLCNTRRHHEVFKDHPQAIYIPWGTDTAAFCPQSTGLVKPGCVTFFHSCGLSAWRKGTDLLVKAFQGVHDPARLLIHAQDKLEKCFTWTRGNESQLTLNLIRGDPRIELIEEETGAPGYYHRGDVYVYPSRLEGIGLTIAEATAAGLPVVTTDAAPMNEMVSPEAGGRLVAVERVEPRWDGYYWPMSVCSEVALTEAMQFFVDQRDRVPVFKRQARAYAERYLDWQVNAHDLPLLITQLKPRRDIVRPDVIAAVRRFEQAGARFAWLPLKWEARLRHVGAGRVVRTMKNLVAWTRGGSPSRS